jgi:hypothetical protein
MPTPPVLNNPACSIIPDNPDQPLEAGIAIIKVKYNKKFPPLLTTPQAYRHDAVSIRQEQTVTVWECEHRDS